VAVESKESMSSDYPSLVWPISKFKIITDTNLQVYFIRNYNGELPPDDPKDPGSKVNVYWMLVYVVGC
jgi:hypothetical protein